VWLLALLLASSPSFFTQTHLRADVVAVSATSNEARATRAFATHSLTDVSSTIAAARVGTLTEYGFQRKTCHTNERFWVFYGNGTDLVHQSSSDGSTWSEAIWDRAFHGSAGEQVSTYCDPATNTYAYVIARQAGNFRLSYRKAALNSDGSLTWAAPETDILNAGTGIVLDFVNLTFDSNGHAWVGYLWRNTTGVTETYAKVTSSSTTDGTWKTASGFPYGLNDSLSSGIDGWSVSPIPLISGRMLVVYANCHIHTIYSRLHDSVWGSQETISNVIRRSFEHSGVSQGDDVHLVIGDTSNHVLYYKWSYGLGWSNAATIAGPLVEEASPVLSIDTSTNGLFVFWGENNHIYYSKFSGQSWSRPTDWITEFALAGTDRLSVSYRSGNGFIGLLYMNGTAGRYQIRYAYLMSNDTQNLTSVVPAFSSTATHNASAQVINSTTASTHVSSCSSIADPLSGLPLETAVAMIVVVVIVLLIDRLRCGRGVGRLKRSGANPVVSRHTADERRTHSGSQHD